MLATPSHFQMRIGRKVAVVTSESVTFSAAADATTTGDIWLFRGSKLNDRFVHAATNSPVNHVAMAVAIEDLPPLLWHTEAKPSTDDVWTGTRHSGVQLQRLEEAVEVWQGRWKHQVFVRQLDPQIQRTHEDELLRVINEYSGRRFPNARGLARRWLSGRARRAASEDTIFCAELIAVTYQRLGLIESRRPANWFDPGRFWSGDRIQLASGFSLGKEVELR